MPPLRQIVRSTSLQKVVVRSTTPGLDALEKDLRARGLLRRPMREVVQLEAVKAAQRRPVPVLALDRLPPRCDATTDSTPGLALVKSAQLGAGAYDPFSR